MMLTEINDTKAPEVENMAQEVNKDCWVIVLQDLVLISGLVPEVNEEDITDWRLIDPYVVTNAKLATISPYLSEYTNLRSFVINKDLIITLVRPNQKLQAKYNSM